MLVKAVGTVASGVGTAVTTALTLRLCVWIGGASTSVEGAWAGAVVGVFLGICVAATLAEKTKAEQWRLPTLGWPRKESSRDV